MLRYKKFLIKAGDHFDEFNYPKLENDIADLKAAIADMPADYKSEIIISRAKGGQIKPDWKAANPTLSEWVSSENSPLRSLGELFDSSSNNPVFREELESYVRRMLN